MNITKEQLDDLNAVLNIKVEEADYQQKVEDVLKDYKKKARIDGFRPGKVPFGMIKKMYYTSVMVDEINKMVSEKLMAYIRDEKIKILGEPMPREDSAKKIDFENDKDFDFSFDLGLSPEINLDVTEKDKITFYHIKIEDAVVNEQIDNVAKRFGEFTAVDAAKGDELIKGDIYQINEKGEAIEDGIRTEEISMSLDMMKNEDEKKKFKGSKAGSRISFDIKKAYPNDTEISSLLKIDKNEVEAISPLFEVEIKEVQKFEKHKVDQDLFDKVYGEGNVKSEEEFKEKIKEELKINYERESMYKFGIDTKDYLIKKANISLPAEFLKRWLVETNEKLSSETVDKEFSDYEDEFRWQLIKEHIIRRYEIAVSEEELFEYAFQLSQNQFFQYGLYNVPVEHIENYAREQLTKPEEARRLREQKFDEKVVQFTKDKVKLEKKDITMDKFRKLFEN
jgi:trigger factor